MPTPLQGNGSFEGDCNFIEESSSEHNRQEEFNIFYSNISSFSPHAKNYISSLSSRLNVKVKALVLVEVHKDDGMSVQGSLRKYGFAAEYTVPEPTTSKNHGGECVATRSHVNSRPVSMDSKISFEIVSEFEYFLVITHSSP